MLTSMREMETSVPRRRQSASSSQQAQAQRRSHPPQQQHEPPAASRCLTAKAGLLLLLLLLLLLVAVQPSSAQYNNNQPNPCPAPYHPVPSLVFPEYYASAYMSTASITAGLSSPFNTSSFTIQFWLSNARTGSVYAATLVQLGNPTLSANAPAGSHINITWTSGDSLAFDTGNGDTCTTSSTTTYTSSINSWSLWTFTYSSIAGTNIKSIYQNGQQVQVTSNSKPALSITQSTPLVLGNQFISFSQTPGWSLTSYKPTNLNNAFAGYMADFRVYGRVLQPWEMTLTATTGVHANNSNLLIWYNFAEQSGSVATDRGSAGLNLSMNAISAWMQQQPAWSGYVLQPLCLWTPTTLTPAGPASSPNCQAVNTAFTVTVSVLDSGGSLVTAFVNATASLTVSRASNSTAFVSVSPSSANISAGVATFTVISTAAQNITLTAVDSGLTKLTPQSTVIAVSAPTGVNFAAGILSTLPGTNQTVSVFASACSGRVLVTGATAAGISTSLRWQSSTDSTVHNQSLNLSSAGTASLSLSSASAAAYTFFLVDKSGRSLAMGGNQSAYWTAGLVSNISVQSVVQPNGTQPSASVFYAGTVLNAAVWAVDYLGGPMAAVTCNVTLTVSNATGNFSQLLSLVDGMATATLTASAAGTATLQLTDTAGTGYAMGPAVTVTFTSGQAVAFVFTPINTTLINVAVDSSVSLLVQAVDAFGNVASTYSGEVSVVSSSGYTELNGLSAPQRVTLSSGQTLLVFYEDTSRTPQPVVLSFNDTAGTGLNVSSQQVIYVQPTASVCSSGSLSSGAVSFNSNSGGLFQNTGDLLSFGSGDFAMVVWAYVTVDGSNYFASQSYYPLAYTQSSTIFNTLFIGPEQQPEALGMTFDMAFSSAGTTWAEYNFLAVAPFAQVGVWTHWVFNFDAATSNQTVWCNGSLVGQRTATAWSVLGSLLGSWQLGMAPITYGKDMTSTCYNCADDDRTTPYSAILMDDLRAYTRHLEDYEITQMAAYNTHSNNAGLVLHYSFDEGLGSVMHDSFAHFDVPTWNATQGASVTWVSSLPNCLPTATQVVIVPPAAVRLGTVMLVTLQAVDAFGNPSAGFSGQAQVIVSGSSGNSAAAVPVSGIVQLTQGQGTISLSDTVPETLSLSLVDCDQTGLGMTSTAAAQFFAGPLYQLAFTSYPSQQAGSVNGSLIVVSCQDQWGNLELSSCTGSVTLLHNSSHSTPASGAHSITLSTSTGGGSVVLKDAAIETVQVRLNNTGGVAAITNCTAIFYSTGAPAALVTGNYSLTGGVVAATVDAAVFIAVRVVDSSGTLCNYYTATFNASVFSASGLATGGGAYVTSAGVAVVPVADQAPENVTLSFSNGSLSQLPSNLTLAFKAGVTSAIVFSGVSWPTQPGLLYTNATATLTIAAVDQYGNPTIGFTGSVTVDAYNSLTSEFNMPTMVSNSTLRSVTVTLINGSASVKVNDSVAETATFGLSNCSVAGLSLGANQLLSFASINSTTLCRYYTVDSAFGSAYYDFPVKSTGKGTFAAWPKGSFVPLNTSQTVKVTVYCVPAAGSTAADTTVNGIQLTLNFSHNQTALINGPCTMTAGVCYLYFQSFAAGNMSISVVDYGPHYFIWPAPYYVLFAQNTPIIWSVSGQSGTTDGSTLVPQLVTMTGQTFMCGQNFSQPPLVQLQDSVTGLVANCPVTAFNATYLSCLLPAGQGKPAIVLTVCGNITQFNLPRWPTDAYFFVYNVFGSTTDNCISMYNVWDFASHTWSDNGLCTKVGRSLIDYRWYQPAYNNTAYGAYPLPVEYANNSYQSVPAEVLTTHRCTSIQELNEPWGWPSMYLCMPVQAPYSWTLSRTGIPEGDSCVPIREGSDPYWSDGSHYMCTPPDTPYPDVDGSQLYYYAAATIASITPPTANCSGNTTITIRGTSFGLNGTGVNTVTVGGNACIINDAAYNNSYLECLLPAGATLFNAVVMTIEGIVAANTPNFPYMPPVITGMNPDSGLTSGSQLVTIFGYNFGFTTATATIGSGSCTVQTVSNTEITCLTPAGSGLNQNVYVTSSYQTNLAAYLWNYIAPSVSEVVPATYDAAGLVPLTVYGSSFGASGATVLVNGQLCAPLTQNHTCIVCTLPAGQGANLSVNVIETGQSSSPAGVFSYNAPDIKQPPDPLGAASGVTTLMTLNGTSFGQSGLVSVNGANCDATAGGGSWANQKVVCLVPAGSGSNVPVVMTVADQVSNTVSFTYSPSISGLNTAAAVTAGGGLLTIYGAGFSSPALINDSVLVNGLSCSVLSQNDSTITCSLPPGQGAANTVQVVGQFNLTSPAVTFAYNAPAVSSQSPLLCPAAGGVNITLSGASFGFGNATTVTINSVQCSVLAANHSSIVFMAPAGSGLSNQLLVKVAGQTSVIWPFTYAAPVISSNVPTSGKTEGGYFELLRGLNFGSSSVPLTAYIGSSAATINARNDSFINLTVGAGQGVITVYVIVDSQVSNAVGFQYDPPSLQSISPSSGPSSGNGTIITLTGDSFGTSGTVNFASASGSVSACPSVSYGQQQILCQLPAGQGTGLNVTVTSGGLSSGGASFSYWPPVIVSVEPSTAMTDGGSIITISGSSFGQGVTGCSVNVGGSSCLQAGSTTTYTDSLILCQLQPGQGTGFATSVTVSGQSFSLPNSFSYSAPAVSSLQPPNGPTSGGFTLTVLGTSFGNAANVSFAAPPGSNGSVSCPLIGIGQSIQQLGQPNEQITCSAPQGQGPSIPVFVTVGGQSSAAVAFAYNAPSISSISPLLAGTNGSTLITLQGANFGLRTNYSLTLNGSSVAAQNLTFSQLTFFMPAGTGVGIPLSLVVATQLAAYTGSLLSYLPPSIVSVSGSQCAQAGAAVTSCPTVGGSYLTIFGYNFGNDAAMLNVSTGALPCTSPTLLLPHTAVQCTLAAQPAGGHNVQVSISVAGQSASSPLLSYAGPTIINHTLVLAGALTPSTGSLTVTDPLLSLSSVSFQGSYWSTNASIAVSYGLPAAPTLYSCSGAAVWVVSNVSSPTVYGVNCSLQVGVGSGLVFLIQVGQLSSTAGVDTLSYPTPALLPGTLRLTLSGDGLSVLVGLSNPGDQLYMDAQHVGNSSSLLQLSFGSFVDGVWTVVGQCGSVSLQLDSAPNATLGCVMPAGTAGARYSFQLTALNAASVPYAGQDEYQYPSIPVVYSVHGCSDSDNATAYCDTVGGELLAIAGTSFDSSGTQMSVRVGSSLCLDIEPVDDTELRCLLQPGSGLQEPVTVTVADGTLASLPVPYVSYSPAELWQVSGCVDSGNNTQDCARAGGTTITVRGTNFGPVAPLLLIGGSQCLNVTQPVDGELYCQTPPGTALLLPLILVQSGGPVTSAASVLLSYTPCPAGSYASSSNVSCLSCPAGSYQDTPGQAACQSCPAGAAPNAAAGATGCVLCPAGSVSLAGSSVCSNCTAGSYSPTAGYAACLTCALGTASDASGATACVACLPGFASSNSSGATSCAACGTGQYASYSGALSCSPCQAGTYAAGSSCIDCAAGSFSPAAYASSCTACAVGSYSSQPHQAACTQCEGGSFANVTGLSACFSCPAGQYSSKGSTGCTGCAAGQYIDVAGQAACLSCPLGTFASAVGSSSCSACPPGQYSPQVGLQSCVACGLGSFASGNGTVACSPCPAGTFGNASGLSACLPCPLGQSQPLSGQQACTPCDDGMAMSSTGQASCIACDSGTFANSTGLPACLQCPAGQSSLKTEGDAAGPLSCQPCAAGSFSATTGQDSCQLCPIGSYANSTGMTGCSLCPAGTQSAGSLSGLTGSSSCSQCAAGYFSAITGAFQCSACSAGTFSNSTAATVCFPCAAGFATTSVPATVCSPCDNGAFAAGTGQSVCSQCQAGTYGPSSNGLGLTSCLNCPAGSFQSATLATTCSPCPAGSAQPAAGQASCVPCAAGYYQPSGNATACVQCPAGFSASGSGAVNCTSCGVGYYAAASGSVSCAACPSGSYSTSQQATACSVCSPGYYAASAGLSTCTACMAGQYATATGSVQCTACPTGTFSAINGSGVCLNCPSGSYQASQGQTLCSLCANGTYSNTTGNQACMDCPAGSIPFLTATDGSVLTGQYGSTYCMQCEPGTYLPSGGSDTCELCPEGSYTPNAGYTACLACIPGYYGPGTGQPACLPCPVGEYQSSSGLASCLQCPPGSTAQQSGQPLCSACAAGSASDQTGLNSSCATCQPGSFQNQLGQTSCSLCEPGTQAAGSQSQTCTPCAAGHYANDSGTVNCAQCPPGSFQPAQGAVNCSLCPIGSFSSADGSQSCTPCAAGSFGNETGLSQCFPCDAGWVQPSTGTSSCAACGVGSEQPYTGRTSCVLCAVGTYTDANGTGNCNDCLSGSYQARTGATDCSACQPGSYNPASTQQLCQSCSPGSFANVSSLSACFPCDAGSYQTQPSASSCSLCPVGSYQPNTGASQCLLCGIGSFGNQTGGQSCFSCPVGSTQTLQGSINCSLCPAGSFANDVGLTACTACSAGSFNPSPGQSNCTQCVPGQFQVYPGMTSCSLCPVGTYLQTSGATVCLQCGTGAFSNVSGSQSCLGCSAGSYQQLTGQSQCDACAAGYYTSGSNQKQCTACPAGSFTSSTGNTECQPCPASQYQPLQGQTACVPCPAGSYSTSNGSTQCASCDRGQYQDATGSTACLPCAAGSFQDYLGQAACQLCPVGYSNPSAGSSTCYVCDVGTATDVNGTASCADCLPGTVQPLFGQPTCTPCPIGQYQPGNRSTACIPCPAGQYAAVLGSSACASCPAGQYQDQQGAGACLPCAAGFYNGDVKQTGCQACSRGQFANVSGLSSCLSCGYGTYGSQDAQVVCPACGNGSYSDQRQQTACSVCATGSFALSGYSACLSCEPGLYQSRPGQSSCLPCPPGQETGPTTGNVQCSPCPSGSFSVGGQSTCTSCAVGTYQPATGNSSCLLCPEGEFGASAGASVCSECGLGQFGNETGLESCFSCPVGTDQPSLGSSSCLACDVGTYTDLPGTHDCYSCAPGSFMLGTRATACSLCPVGSYQELAGESFCSLCPVGQYADGSGSQYCKACPQGSFSTVTGAVNCTQCAAGSFQNDTGQTACLLCAPPTYAPTAGYADCSACPQGTYGSVSGQTACNACPAGYYQTNISSTSCGACGPGYYSGAGAIQCEVCGTGQVTDEQATTNCFACPPVTTQPNFEQTECICNAGYYMPYYTPGNNTFVCESCPTGGDCSAAGTDWTNLQSLPCYWRANNVTLNFYRCPICSYCLGGLAAGSAAETQLDSGTYTPVSVWDATATPCLANRGGIMCSSCIEGYEEQTGGACVPCPSGAGSYVLAVVVAAVLVGLLVFSFWLMLRSDRRLFENFDRPDALEAGGGGLRGRGGEAELDGFSSDGSSDSDSSSDGSDSDASSRSSSKAAEEQKTEDGQPAVVKPVAGKADGQLGDESSSASSASDSGSESGSDSESDSESSAGGAASAEPVGNSVVTAVQFSGPPEPPENFTYKLKILLGFLQIATALSSGLDIQWPTMYKTFLLNFDVINFDSILGNVTSSQCIGAVTYYREFLVIVLTPLCALLLLIIAYVIPSSFDLLCYRHQTLQSKLRTRMKFWKLLLYSLFLMYPALSSNVLRLYVCVDIDGTQWLLTNLRVQCYTSAWYQYAYIAAPFILVYPIGIPLFFTALLFSNRRHLHQRRVQAQLGFLYASYQRQLWWFEILDSVHKLFLTSVLAFFPAESQLPLGMGVVTLYSMIILSLQPFLSPADDLLQLLALTELQLLLLAGWIYYSYPSDTFSGSQDSFVSVCLIALTVLFFLAFMLAFCWAFRKVAMQLFVNWRRQQQLRRDKRSLHEQRQAGGKQHSAAAAVQQKDAPGQDARLAKEPATPSRTAKVAPSLPLPQSQLQPLSSSRQAAERSGSSRQRQASGSDSDGDSNGSGESDSERAAGGARRGGRPGSASASALHSPAGSKARDAWSSPPTPLHAAAAAAAGAASPRLPPAAAAVPPVSARGRARQTAAAAAAPIPEEDAAAAAADDDDGSEGEDDGRRQQPRSEPPLPASLQAQRPSLPPVRAHRLSTAARPSIASGGAAPGRSATLSLPPLSAQPPPAVSAALGKKKKRKVIRAGDNFQQGQATGISAVVSPFKQLFND